MEYLVSRYVDTDACVAGQGEDRLRILSEHYGGERQEGTYQGRIKEKGQYTFLGTLGLRLDQSKDHYWAERSERW